MNSDVIANVIGRLAPSPTGAQHLGNARTYCLAYWAARSAGGHLKLRIEDVDTPRIKPGASAEAVEDLHWLGITWSGQAVIQTQRMPRYANIIEQLKHQNAIYPCICTRRDIESAGSAPHFDHEPPIYPGTCAGWQTGDALPSDPYCWRFRCDGLSAEFDDLLYGKQRCQIASQLGDFPITQKTGNPAYQLAVVVDDHDFGINQIVRGNDLIVSTFRQLAIHAALGWTPPVYGHVPLVIGPDGRRLAKRHGDTRMSTIRDNGGDPLKIIRWAALSAGFVDPPQASAGRNIDDFIESFAWPKLNRDDVHVPS